MDPFYRIKRPLPKRWPIRRAVLLILVLLFTVVLIHLTPVRGWLKDIHLMGEKIKAFGVWAPAAYVVLVCALVAAGIPRLLFCTIGGMVFGFFWGLVWSQAGTVVGYYATFLFVRWSGREFILNKLPGLNKYSDFFTAGGIPYVLLIRQLPIAGFYINIVLGLTHIRNSKFLLGTVVGILPEAIPATLIGAGLINLSPGKSVVAISAAVIFLIIVWSLVGRYLGSSRFKMSAAGNESIQIRKDEISA